MSYTNQEFVKSLIDPQDYESIWTEALKQYSTNKGFSEKDEMTIFQCSFAQKLSSNHLPFWNNLLTRSDRGLQWPENFDEEIVSPEIEENSAQRRRSISGKEAERCERRIIGYIDAQKSDINLLNTSKHLTHLSLLSAINVQSNGSLRLFNEVNNIYDKIYELKALRKQTPELKLLFSIGGWNNSEHFSLISQNTLLQKIFIMDILAFLDYWDFDGIDIIWQYPVMGGKVTGNERDRINYINLLKNIKDSLIAHQKRKNRSNDYLLVITGPGIYWIVENGYDLKNITNYVDWVNVLAFDFFGAWDSSWGSYTGPHSPLYFGFPDGYPGKMNVDSIIKKYACEIEDYNRIVLGIGFYGRYWNNVGNQINNQEDELFRSIIENESKQKGGFVSYKQIKNEWLQKYESKFHDKTKTPYIWNQSAKSLLSYENEKSIAEKMKYVIKRGLGGVMIWSLDMDDSDASLLNSIISEYKCQPETNVERFKCNPLKGEKRYWTQYDDNGSKDRMCGKRAPLINGHYAVCDPDDPGYSCCSDKGYCGSGPDFCDCKGCIDFGKNPEKIINESTPSSISVLWHTMDVIMGPSEPVCGHNAKLLPKGQVPICNPDDPKGHCCSSTGFCGTGPDYCSCPGCVNFNKNITIKYEKGRWFEWKHGPEKIGRCGPKAPKIGKNYAICDPSSDLPCCGVNGFCGKGPQYCECKDCINFKQNPGLNWV